MMTWNTLISNAYMWDPTKFYDNLEHSIFKNNAYMWDRCWFMMFFHILWRHKIAWNREHPATVPTVMKNFLVTKFARKLNIMTRSSRIVINQ
jgi:hypothetical protein